MANTQMIPDKRTYRVEEIAEISEIITDLIIPDNFKRIWSVANEKEACDNFKKNKE